MPRHRREHLLPPHLDEPSEVGIRHPATNRSRGKTGALTCDRVSVAIGEEFDQLLILCSASTFSLGRTIACALVCVERYTRGCVFRWFVSIAHTPPPRVKRHAR